MTSWTQQIDNKDFVEPSAIHGLANGSDALKAVLHPLFDHEGNQVGLAAPVAAQSYNAMVQAAWREGVVLKPSSSADTFRSLSIQQQIFRARYTTKNTGVAGRTCGGTYYWKVSTHVATAACPGTSNHGKGCAVDFDLQFPGSLSWLEAHAKSFGWQWEVSSEDWHLHYMLGDRLPEGITPDQEDDMTPDQDARLKGVSDAAVETRDNVRKLVTMVADLEKRVAAVEAKQG